VNEKADRPIFITQEWTELTEWGYELQERESEDYDPYQYVYDAEDNITNDGEILIEFDWE
jgi:hypothetical protein